MAAEIVQRDSCGVPVTAGVSQGTGEVRNLKVDETSGALIVSAAPMPTRRKQVVVSLVGALTNSVVSFSGLTNVTCAYVRNLVGTATMSINNTTDHIAVANGDAVEGMGITSIYLTTPGGAGGTITIELHGN